MQWPANRFAHEPEFPVLPSYVLAQVSVGRARWSEWREPDTAGVQSKAESFNRPGRQSLARSRPEKAGRSATGSSYGDYRKKASIRMYAAYATNWKEQRPSPAL